MTCERKRKFGMWRLTIVVACVASPAATQTMCTVETGLVPPCMVGTWVGSSDMAERMEMMFAGLPENVRAHAMESSGRALFIRIERDGWFVTSTLSAGADITFLTDSGSAGEMEVALRTTGGTGFFTAGSGDTLAFCSTTGGFATVTMDGSPAPVVPDGDVSVMPMRQSCSGDELLMFVDLPPPMGTVTYTLDRVPEADIPPELRDMLPTR